MAVITKEKVTVNLKQRFTLSKLKVIWLLHSVRGLDPFYPFRLFNAHSLGTCYIPGTVPDTEEPVMNTTEEIPVLRELVF